ncbi:MAG TPA: hypothetical protein VIF15_03895 [Polyangiaceae bacterium]
MSHSSHSSLLKLCILGAALAAAACASAPTPPPAAAAPPAQAFQQASGGVTAPQGNPDDGVQFVEQERKEPQTHEDGAPATNLHPEKSARPKY